MKTVALAGGVGAARLLRGLTKLVPPRDLTIIGNTGDDFTLYGLHISPDLDTIMYTLAGIVNETNGWGIKNDTHNTLKTLGKLGQETWFKLGDKDLATHIIRTKLLKEGKSLAQATAQLMKMYNLKTKLVPMSNQPVHTKIVSPTQTMDFQEYFVRHQTKPRVTNVIYENAEKSEPAPGIVEAIDHARRIIICPSNPILSIAPILAIPAIRRALQATKAYTVAISPIIAGKTIKGPAAKIMNSMGLDASAIGVAKYYKDTADEIIIDQIDASQRNQIQKLRLKVTITNTIMKNLEDSTHLSRIALKKQKRLVEETQDSISLPARAKK